MSSITAINSAAHSLAMAHAKVEQASAQLESALKLETQIEDRISALDSKRDQIIGRRQQGKQEPEDGANLALIAADLEGLAPLLNAAEKVTKDARLSCASARPEVDGAVQALQYAEDQKAESDLAEHARKLDALLLTAVQRFNVVRKRVGGGIPKWGPSPALALELRKLQAERREI